MHDPHTTPSDANVPEQDENPIRESVLMLHLAVAQVLHSLQESDESIMTVGGAFGGIVGDIERTRAAAIRLADSPEKSTILDNCDSAADQIGQAVVALQFYDRLSQRLSHVADSLGALGKLVSRQTRGNIPEEWNGQREKIRSSYTTETEHQIFDAIMSGASIDEAIKWVTKTEKNTADNEIEMF